MIMKNTQVSISDKIHNTIQSVNKICKNYSLFLVLKLRNIKKLFCGDVSLTRYYFLGVFLIFVEQANANPNKNTESTQKNASQDSKQSDMTQIKLDKVTATANEYDIQSEAKNIIVIDKDDIANKGYTNLEQALEHQPAITFTPGPNGQKQIDIRGQGMDAVKAVKIMVNGVPININDSGYGATRSSFVLNGANPFNLIDVNDIESIEILPGGGSVVYGSGTRGGVVNIVTKKSPQDFVKTSLSGGVFSHHSLPSNTKASVGGGYNFSNRFYLGANASYSYKNGLRKGEYTKAAYAALQGIYEITQNSKVDINASYTKSHQLSLGYNNKLNADGSEKSLSQLKFERYALPDSQSLNGPAQQDLAQASIKYNASLSEKTNFEALGFYAFSDFFYSYKNDEDVESGDSTGNITGTNKNHNTGLNLRLKYNGDIHTWLFGIDNTYEVSEAVSVSYDKRNGAKYALGIYALDSINKGKFGLIAGVRGELLYYDINRLVNVGQPQAHILVRDYRKSIKSNSSAEISPSFNYTSTGSVYLKGEYGFISPSIGQLVNVGNLYDSVGNRVNGTPQDSNVKPESYITAEIGLKDKFSFGSLQTSIYYTHTYDEIRSVFFAVPLRNWYNLGETQRFGVELSSSQYLGEIVSLQESVNFNYSNVLKGRRNAADINSSSTTQGAITDSFKEGTQIPYTPSFKVSLSSNIRAIKTSNHALDIFVNHSYYASQLDNNYFIMNKGGYVIGDIGLNYKYKNFALSAGVRNMYDSFYVSYQRSSIDTNNTITRRYLAGEGRNYFLEAKIEI